MRELGLYNSTLTVAEADYCKLPISRRQAIEAKAKYLKLMADPPNPTWEAFTKKFAEPTNTLIERNKWLHSLGLDYYPFNAEADTLDIEEVAKEAAWGGQGVGRRRVLETMAGASALNLPADTKYKVVMKAKDLAELKMAVRRDTRIDKMISTFRATNHIRVNREI